MTDTADSKLNKVAIDTSIDDTESVADTTSGRSRSVVMWQIIFVAVMLIFLIFLGWRLIQTNQSEQRAAGQAPAFSFTTFDGEAISLDDLEGKGVVLNFWASWCDPCRDEAALMQAYSVQESENGVVFIGLDYLDQEPAALEYLEQYGITYPNGPDLQSDAARRYGIKGVPETFFINPSGQIVETIIGPITSDAQMESLLGQIRPGQ